MAGAPPGCSASPSGREPASPDGGALGRLIDGARRAVANAACGELDINRDLAGLVEDALREHAGDERLAALLQRHGWRGGTFDVEGQHVDVRELSNDLRLVSYVDQEEIGRGSYAVVYRASNRLTGERGVVKRLKLESHGDGVSATAIREISILKDLQHPHVVR